MYIEWGLKACKVNLTIEGAFPKLGGNFVGFPVIRMIVFVGLCWVPPF